MLVFPVWVSRVKYLCIVCFICHLLSCLNLSSSLILGLVWKCYSFSNNCCQCVQFQMDRKLDLLFIYLRIWGITRVGFWHDSASPKGIIQFLVPILIDCWYHLFEDMNQWLVCRFRKTITLTVIIWWLAHQYGKFSTKGSELWPHKNRTIVSDELLRNTEPGHDIFLHKLNKLLWANHF